MITVPSLSTLQKAVKLSEQIEKLQQELSSLLDSELSQAVPAAAKTPAKAPAKTPVKTKAPANRVSPQGSKRIAEAQRRRWERFRLARKKAAEPTPQPSGKGGHEKGGMLN